jgi:hypothetical protein
LARRTAYPWRQHGAWLRSRQLLELLLRACAESGDLLRRGEGVCELLATKRLRHQGLLRGPALVLGLERLKLLLPLGLSSSLTDGPACQTAPQSAYTSASDGSSYPAPLRAGQLLACVVASHASADSTEPGTDQGLSATSSFGYALSRTPQGLSYPPLSYFFQLLAKTTLEFVHTTPLVF